MVSSFLGGFTGGMAGGAVLSIVAKVNDQASGKLKDIDRSAQQTAENMRRNGMIMVGAAAAIGGALISATRAAPQEEVGIRKLSVAMQNVGISYDQARGSLESWIDANQQATAFADTEQREALSSLITMTGDLAQSQELLSLAMDMSVGTGRDLLASTTTLGYALAGNWGMVNRMIPALAQIQTEEEKWAFLREKFAGQAEAFGQTMAGQWQVMMHNIGDLKEAIGEVLVPVLLPLVEGAKDLVQALKQMPAPVLRIGVVFAGLSAIMLGGRGLFMIFRSFGGVLGNVVGGLGGVANTAPAAGGALGRLGGVMRSTTGLAMGLASAISMVVMGIMELNRVKGLHAELQSLSQQYASSPSVETATALEQGIRSQVAQGLLSQEQLANADALAEWIASQQKTAGDSLAGMTSSSDLANTALMDTASAANMAAGSMGALAGSVVQAASACGSAAAAALGAAGAGASGRGDIIPGGKYDYMNLEMLRHYQQTGQRWFPNAEGGGAYLEPLGFISTVMREAGYTSPGAWRKGGFPGIERLTDAEIRSGGWFWDSSQLGGGGYVSGHPSSRVILPGPSLPSYLGGYGEGGIAGLHGPELAWLGEREPELVIPQSKLGPGKQTVNIYLDGELVESKVIDRMDQDVRLLGNTR